MTSAATRALADQQDELMKIVNGATHMIEQPLAERNTPSPVRRIVSRFITAADTAALLEVTEGLLSLWHAQEIGLQPVSRPEGN